MVAAIVGGEGVISGWNLGTASYTFYYADSARSMALNNHALLFGAFDPGATITLDKLSGFLLPQVLSIRLFGFHPWSTLLPQVLEGMVTVLAGYVIGARWKGPAAGLVAAAAMATTPLLVFMFGRGGEDGLLTMSLALAFWCWQSALLGGRLLPLMGACAWVAVGFQAKMMEAWFIVPALGVAYLLAAPHPLAQRIRRALLAAAVTLVLSLVWVSFIQLTPASERPYIDGTTNNNAFTMVFGFNGFNRFIPNLIPGVLGNTSNDASAAAKSSAVTGLQAPRQASSEPIDPAFLTSKLLQPRYTTQVGWLYPLAAAGAALTVFPALTVLRRRRRRSSAAESLPAPGIRPPLNASTGTGAALLGWLIVDAVFETATNLPHAIYLAAVSVQIAVFSGVAIVQAARWCRSEGWARFVFPTLLTVQVGWTIWVLHSSSVAPTFLVPTIAVLGCGVIIAALCGVKVKGAHRARPARPMLRLSVAAGATLVTLLAPAAWSMFNITIVNAGYGYSYGGPLQVGRFAGHPAISSGGQPFQVRSPLTRTNDPQLNPAQQNLYNYLRAQVRTGTLMAADSWALAEPFILDTGSAVIPMGGFLGLIDTPTLPQLHTDIARGRLRFILLQDLVATDGAGGTEPAGYRNALGTIDGPLILGKRTWITSHCRFVPESTYETPDQHLTGQKLYSCPSDANFTSP